MSRSAPHATDASPAHRTRGVKPCPVCSTAQQQAMKSEAPGASSPAQLATGPAALPLARKVDDTLLKSLLWMAAHHGKPASEDALVAGLPAGRFISPQQAQLALEGAGFAAGV